MQGWARGREGERARGSADTTTRLLKLALLGLLWAIAILCRLVYLQVAAHNTYKELADQQQQRTLRLDAPRGAILDRSGHPLALSVPVDSVCINPLRVPDRALAADLLSRVLGVDRQELLEKLDRAVAEHERLGRKAKGSGFLWVKRRITPAESERLRSLKLEWVEFRKESQRYYPDGPVGSHVVGTVDFQQKGNLGLEQALDHELAGKPGTVRMITDVQQRGVESLSTNEAQPGQNLTLAIDERVQYVAERELTAACQLHHAASGSAVVMDPETGELLALASYPPFDPNTTPEPDDPPTARFDFPVSVAFEPGSVFKIITLSAALETTSLKPESLINCGGGVLNLYGRIIHEAKHGYGVLSMADVLAKSSNIGAIQIGLRVGEKNLLEYIRRFGFGQRTGIPLPAESSGRVRGLKYWRRTSIGSVAMGHEISTTALQLAQACSVIANGGLLIKPRLILRRQRPGDPVEEQRGAPPKRILRPETAITMRQMMEGVVLHGTGRAARVPGYTVGGKTGSAQIFDPETRHYTHLYNGSFVGFSPVTRPRIVIAVTLNRTKLFGGVVAAPVFKTIAQETLRLLDIPRDLPDAEPPDNAPADTNDLAIADLADPPEDLLPSAAPAPALPAPAAAEPTATVVAYNGPTVPNFQGKAVRDVLQESLAKGVPVELIGRGVARGQEPAPGSPLNPGVKVRVLFQ